jgi:hypothetical protein
MAENYRLIFGGLTDTSTETLRRVRTVLVGELGLSVEEAKKIFIEAPSTLLEGRSQQEILSAKVLLENAGALMSLSDSAVPFEKEKHDPDSVASSEADRFWQELEGSCLIDISPSILKDVKGYNPLPSRGIEVPKGIPNVIRKPWFFEKTWKRINTNRVLSAELTFSLGFSVLLLLISMASA